jgi:hypothetical protein
MDKQSKDKLKNNDQRISAQKGRTKTAMSLITWGAVSFIIGAMLIASVVGAPLGILLANGGFFSFIIGVIWRIFLGAGKNAE